MDYIILLFSCIAEYLIFSDFFDAFLTIRPNFQPIRNRILIAIPFIGIYFGYASGVSPLLSYAYGNKSDHICKKLENYARCFFIVAPLILYIVAYCTSPLTVSCFTEPETTVFSLALNGMRLYGIGYLFSGFNIYATIRLTSYGKGHYSAIITLLRSFILLLLFLYFLPNYLQLNGVWLAMPAAEFLTLFVTLYINHKFKHIL